MTESAQVFKGVHDTPNYTDIFFDSRCGCGSPSRWAWASRQPSCPPSCCWTPVTCELFCPVDAHHRLTAGIGAIIPHGRPRRSSEPAPVACPAAQRPPSADTATLAPPREVIGNLSFTEHGVYAHFLLRAALLPATHQEAHRWPNATSPCLANCRPAPGFTGCQYLKTSVNCCARCCTGTATSTTGSRPARTCKPPWPRHTRAPEFLADHPVDAGRGHSPVGQLTKVGDWIAGRDKDSEASLRPTTGWPRRHHRPPRGIRPDPGQPTKWSTGFGGTTPSGVHQPAAPPPRARLPVRQPTAHRRVRRRRPGAHAQRGPGGALDPVVQRCCGSPTQMTVSRQLPGHRCPSSTCPAKASSSPAPES